MDATACDDRDLLLEARNGKADSFGTLFRRHRTVVLAFLARRVQEPEVAADLLAETFASLLELVRDDRRELPGMPSAWLLVTARNLLIDRHRHGVVADRARRAMELAPIALEDQDIVLIAEAAASEQLLQRIRELLPDEQADALTARFVEELDYAEIARRTKSSETAVRKRVSRALSTLRTTLGS